MNFAHFEIIQHLPVSLSWFEVCCCDLLEESCFSHLLLCLSCDVQSCALVISFDFTWESAYSTATLETDHSGAANTLLLGEASASCSQLELGQFSSLLWVAQAFPLSFSMDGYSVWDDFPQWDQMQAASSTAFHPKVPSLFTNFKLTFGLYKICMARWPTKVIKCVLTSYRVTRIVFISSPPRKLLEKSC